MSVRSQGAGSSVARAADAGDHYIVASGEADLACRITHMPKALFA